MRWWFTILLAFLSVPGAQAQGWAQKMFTAGTTHDFGTVPRGAQLLHKFSITNIYAVPMTVTQVVPGCNCISASVSKKTLEPNETGTIDIGMDASRFVGPKKVAIRVTVGSGVDYFSSADIIVSAVSRADVVFNPGEINLGSVPVGQKATARVEVEYAGSLPWTINELVVGKLPVVGTFKETYRQPNKVGYEVEISLKGDAPAGSIKDFVYLKTNDSQTTLVPLLVNGAVVSELTVTPENLVLGEIPPRETLSRRVVVRGSRPFSITRVEIPDGVVQASTTLPSPESSVQTLGLSIRGDRPGALRSQVKIHTSLGTTPLVVSVEGTVGDR